jgi:hypothetical protein
VCDRLKNAIASGHSQNQSDRRTDIWTDSWVDDGRVKMFRAYVMRERFSAFRVVNLSTNRRLYDRPKAVFKLRKSGFALSWSM